MDDLDQASEYAELHLQNAIRSHYEAVEPSDGNGICIDCGDPIPAARLKIDPGFRRCIACQTRQEKNQHKG